MVRTQGPSRSPFHPLLTPWCCTGSRRSSSILGCRHPWDWPPFPAPTATLTSASLGLDSARSQCASNSASLGSSRTRTSPPTGSACPTATYPCPPWSSLLSCHRTSRTWGRRPWQACARSSARALISLTPTWHGCVVHALSFLHFMTPILGGGCGACTCAGANTSLAFAALSVPLSLGQDKFSKPPSPSPQNPSLWMQLCEWSAGHPAPIKVCCLEPSLW